MQNILNILYAAIPRLKQIENTSENMELIPSGNWDTRIKSIFTKNLKRYGKSTTPAGLETYFHPCIIETQITGNETLVLINREKYLLIRKYLMSEEFNK